MIEAAGIGIEAALGQCGVADTTLAPREKDSLDRDGYLLWPAVVDAAGLEPLRAAFERAMSRGRQGAGDSRSGTRHVDLFGHEDAAFDPIYTHPKVLAAVHHVLRRPFRVLQLGGREPLPGYGQQGLHTDWLPRVPSEPFRVVTSIWLLDDFTPRNGATRLVPGSHLLPRPLPKSMLAPASRHPDQTLVLARAGSVLVFNGHLWHSGTRNETNRRRRVLQCQFVTRDRARLAVARSDFPGRLTPAARHLLGA